MQRFGPQALTPRDGAKWLRQALALLTDRPLPFLAAGLLAPCGSALLLALPVWDDATLLAGGWFAALATVLCYGLPLTVAITLACGLARSINRQRPLWVRQLLVPSVIDVLLRSALFLTTLLVQGYLAVYLIHQLLDPATMVARLQGKVIVADPFFGVADTLLATQLSVTGALLLSVQFLFACFVAPLQLFRELPLPTCWRLSFMAVQINPWLLPTLGLPGVAFLVLSRFEMFSVVAQVLALPLPPYLGALLYIAWLEVFQGGVEEEILAAKPPELKAASIPVPPPPASLR